MMSQGSYPGYEIHFQLTVGRGSRFNPFSIITLYFTTYLNWSDRLYFYCFFTFEYFDSFDHSAACYGPLNLQYSDCQAAYRPTLIVTFTSPGENYSWTWLI